MNTELLPNEKTIMIGTANLQTGIDAVSGGLFLTNQRLIFEPYRFNIQIETTTLPLDSISTTRLCWTRLFNLIPLLPNSLAVQTTDGQEYRFALPRRQQWQRAIVQQLHDSPEKPGF
jgi:hypothetical protein